MKKHISSRMPRRQPGNVYRCRLTAQPITRLACFIQQANEPGGCFRCGCGYFKR